MAEKIRTGRGGEEIGHISPGMLSTLSTELLFPSADVVIADYSSLIYEYLLFGKPLILYVPDLEEYESRRGFYQEFDEIPGILVQQEEELADTVRKCTGEAGGTAQFLKRYMSACDGHATERILRWILENAS